MTVNSEIIEKEIKEKNRVVELMEKRVSKQEKLIFSLRAIKSSENEDGIFSFDENLK